MTITLTLEEVITHVNAFDFSPTLKMVTCILLYPRNSVHPADSALLTEHAEQANTVRVSDTLAYF
jgi:hypothetical protein